MTCMAWRTFLSQGPHDTNQQESNKSRNDPDKGDALSHGPLCVCILCNSVSSSLEVFSHQACVRKTEALEIREMFVMDRTTRSPAL